MPWIAAVDKLGQYLLAILINFFVGKQKDRNQMSQESHPMILLTGLSPLSLSHYLLCCIAAIFYTLMNNLPIQKKIYIYSLSFCINTSDRNHLSSDSCQKLLKCELSQWGSRLCYITNCPFHALTRMPNEKILQCHRL